MIPQHEKPPKPTGLGGFLCVYGAAMSRRKRLAEKPTPATASRVRKVRPHPEAWATALKIAKGQASRIEVRSEWDLIVHNAPH